MQVKPPPGRRKFASAWDEIMYLHDKLLYWLYQREDERKACPYAKRLEQLLPRATPTHEGMLGEECWSLVYETKGDLAKAIKHREKEIRLIHRLHELVRKSPCDQCALEGYGYDDLSDRLDLLAILYHDSGQFDKAIRTLQESKRLCKAHGLTFDGEDMLREYVAEKRLADLSRVG